MNLQEEARTEVVQERVRLARRLDRAAEIVSRRLRKYAAGCDPRLTLEGQRLALHLVANALRDGDDPVLWFGEEDCPPEAEG